MDIDKKIRIHLRLILSSFSNDINIMKFFDRKTIRFVYFISPQITSLLKVDNKLSQ